MTPPQAPQSEYAREPSLHLTEDQFGQLLAGPPESTESSLVPTRAHLRACAQCSAELDNLRDSLSLFRQASTAYANEQLRQMPQVSLPRRRVFAFVPQPAYWAAAAALLLAAFLPMQTLRPHPAQPVSSSVAITVAANPAESDEALMDDVNREVSASVPTPMQALVDPTASGPTGVKTSTQNSDQRKD